MTPTAARRRGFSIFELLLVLLVLSLLAATTIRYYFSRADVTLENAAILLARDLRAAQHRSVFLEELSLFTFNAAGDGYSVTDERGVPAKNPQTGQAFERLYPDDGVFHGVAIVAAVAGTDRTLVIDAHGMPDENLEVTLVYHEERRTVLMERGTGHITIGGSTSGWTDLDL